jgi:hypothetical protein
MKFNYSLAILLLVLPACSGNSSNLSNQATQTSVSSAESVKRVSSLCELFDNPYSYQQKVVRLKTSIYSTNIDKTYASFGDERCEQRHPLIDVDFSQELEAAACKKENPEQEKLCAVISKTGNNITDVTYELLADVIGYFEYYETKEGFTRNGMRFRFRVNKIENIEKITASEIQRIQ